MRSNSRSNGLPSGLTLQSDERRKRRRFDIHFTALLRALNDSWSVGETDDVGATGAFLVTDRPFLVSTPVEYVLTFPPDLTKVPNPLRVRFFGRVLRCERIPDTNSVFGIAVQSAAHRYLSQEQLVSFDAIEQEALARQSSGHDSASAKPGTHSP
jgi:hypothetical protein